MLLLGVHNDMPNGRPGVSHPQGVFAVFSYYKLVILFINMVCLTVHTSGVRKLLLTMSYFSIFQLMMICQPKYGTVFTACTVLYLLNCTY
jgi:hypothetical protein